MKAPSLFQQFLTWLRGVIMICRLWYIRNFDRKNLWPIVFNETWMKPGSILRSPDGHLILLVEYSMSTKQGDKYWVKTLKPFSWCPAWLKYQYQTFYAWWHQRTPPGETKERIHKKLFGDRPSGLD